MIEQGQVALAAAAIGQLAGDHQRGAVELAHRVEAYIRPARAFRRGQRLDLVVDAHIGQGRVHLHTDLALVVTHDEAHGLEVDEQRIGADEEGLVLVAAIVVEHGQLRQVEVAAVQYQVTGDALHAIGTQIAQQQPEFFHVQLGVATALEVEAAIEYAILQLAVAVELGLPLMRGAEEFKCCVSGDQLHGRGRVNRDIGVVDDAGARAIERDGDQRQAVGAELVGRQ